VGNFFVKEGGGSGMLQGTPKLRKKSGMRVITSLGRVRMEVSSAHPKWEKKTQDGGG